MRRNPAPDTTSAHFSNDSRFSISTIPLWFGHGSHVVRISTWLESAQKRAARPLGVKRQRSPKVLLPAWAPLLCEKQCQTYGVTEHSALVGRWIRQEGQQNQKAEYLGWSNAA